MAPALDTATLCDPATLAALEPEWWALWRRCPGATPFQSPAWLLPWWEVFHPGELCTVSIRQSGRLVGLAPLWLETCAEGQRLLPLGIGISDYLDVLIDPDFPGAAAALSRHLSQPTTSWREWELPELAMTAMTRQLPCPAHCMEDLTAASICPVLTLAGQADLEAVLPKTRRRKLRMAHRRIRRMGEPSILPADNLNVGALIDELVRLNRRRHSERGDPSVFEDERVAAFHRLAAPLLLSAGLLRLSAMLLGPDAVAVYYGLHWRGRAYAYLSGFDARHAYESPGSILLEHAIESAMAEGAAEFDFLRGEEAYKYDWGAAPRRNASRVFRRMAADARA